MNLPASLLLAILSTMSQSDRVFGSPAGRAYSRELLRASGFGLADRSERAAFIVDPGDGALQCLAWPALHQNLEARYEGPIPAGTIAIIHTHPVAFPLPSGQDKEEASRLGLPIYVLSLTGVSKALPETWQPLVITRRMWIADERASLPYHCQPIAN
jgi:hypothetical protein